MAKRNWAACVDVPERRAGKKAVVFNRAPLAANAMAKLPLGSVRANGWLRHQLDLMVNGMTGRLAEVSGFLKPENGWLGGPGSGWEEPAYWFRGFYDLGALTGDGRIEAESTRWIETILASQDADGYFGARHEKAITGKNGQVICDLWPHMVMIDALISHYEFTGDARVVPFLTKFFEFCRNLPDEQFCPQKQDGFGDWKPIIQVARAGDMVPHLHWLFNRTGERWLLDLAARFYKQIMPPSNEWLDIHVINFTQRFGYPGVFSAQTGESWQLGASEFWYAQHMATWGQQPRGIFGADELIRSGQVDPRQAFETCGVGEFNKNFYMLGRLTGLSFYADRVEDLMFNHFPAMSTPDLKGLHYLTASNQPQLDASGQHEYTNKGWMICYSPGEVYRCCQHNVAMTWPWFVENLWQATADAGLAAWMYGPCEVTAKVGAARTEVSIVEETEYPFEERVRLRVRAARAAEWPLYLRVPRWAEGFEVEVNGKRAAVEAAPGAYVRLERTWKDGDAVAVAMKAGVSVTRWPRTGAATVDRGPLSYSVKIGERWQRCGGGSDEWPEWEVFPTTPWNYALVLDPKRPAAGMKAKRVRAVADQPWTPDAAPLEMTVKAKRLPGWGMENETVQRVPLSPAESAEPVEEITMIPLGCARLRIACLPVLKK